MDNNNNNEGNIVAPMTQRKATMTKEEVAEDEEIDTHTHKHKHFNSNMPNVHI